jgi:hypothetical protein
VLEEMREARAARLLVGGSDVIPDVDRHRRHALVLMQDDVQPVGQRELPIRNLQDRCRGLGADRDRQQRKDEHDETAAHEPS